MTYIQVFVHYFSHLVVPVFIAFIFFNKPGCSWLRAYLIMLLTMLVDLDHLLASPVFDPNRCSIGFHFLHSYLAIAIYIVMVFFRKTRIMAVGLIWHIVTDFIDCQFMQI